MIRNFSFWLYFSLATILISVAIIVLIKPTFGIDFVGGSLLELKVPDETDPGAVVQEVRSVLSNDFQLSPAVQTTGENALLVRVEPIDGAKHQEILTALKDKNLVSEELRFESIGPTIGEELRRKAIIASVVAVVLMVAYLSYEFRKASGLIAPWKFGVAATYALVHDTFVITALFVILGKTHQVAIDSLFMTAMLAIGGYSINDTVVVFNRFKQEWARAKSDGLDEIMRRAIWLSLRRSIYTAFTVFLTLLALLLFGGVTLRWFTVALLAGTIVGTYSTFYVAPALLYFLAHKSQK